MQPRVGFGFDVHQLKEGATLTIGGVEVPHSRGSIGHSDADVLVHAICDALLGAACMGDIGTHFPPSDDQYKGIDSKILLKEVIEILRNDGYEIGNIDSTVCLQRPMLKDHIPEMREKLAEVLSIQKNRISVKATTTERMGFVGKEKGVSAYAIVLIMKIPME